MLNTKGWFQDRDRNNEIRGKNEVLFPINTKTVWAELFAEDVQCSSDVLGIFVDDVEVGIGLDEAAGRSSDGS